MSLCSVSPDAAVNRLVENCGYATAALTLLPIPGSEIIGVVPLHVGMVIGIANHHGRTLNEESATELLLEIGTTVGASLMGSHMAITAAKVFLPGLGGIVAAPFMFASTLGLGAVADAWFRRGSLSEREMREIYSRAKSKAKAGFDPEKAHDPEHKNAAREATKRGKRGTNEHADRTTEATPMPRASQSAAMDPVARLRRAGALRDEGLLTEEEFAAIKADVLSDL